MYATLTLDRFDNPFVLIHVIIQNFKAVNKKINQFFEDASFLKFNIDLAQNQF